MERDCGCVREGLSFSEGDDLRQASAADRTVLIGCVCGATIPTPSPKIIAKRRRNHFSTLMKGDADEVVCSAGVITFRRAAMPQDRDGYAAPDLSRPAYRFPSSDVFHMPPRACRCRSWKEVRARTALSASGRDTCRWPSMSASPQR